MAKYTVLSGVTNISTCFNLKREHKICEGETEIQSSPKLTSLCSASSYILCKMRELRSLHVYTPVSYTHLDVYKRQVVKNLYSS